jgi:hypothetical protein
MRDKMHASVQTRAATPGPRHPLMFDMEVIVRRHDQEHCASITCMIRHYVARRAQVTEGHPHNAAMMIRSGCWPIRTRPNSCSVALVSAGGGGPGPVPWLLAVWSWKALTWTG